MKRARSPVGCRPPLDTILRRAGARPGALKEDQRRAIEGMLDTLLPPEYGGVGGEKGIFFVRVPGFGKTKAAAATVICLAHILEVDLRVLVLMPDILKPTWRAEISDLMPSATVENYVGGATIKSARAEQRAYDAARANFFLCSMCVFRSEFRRRNRSLIWSPDGTMSPCMWDFFIFDEAHNLRSNTRQMFRSVMSSRGHWFAEDGKAILQTGTPFFNSKTDVYNLLNLCEHSYDELRGAASLEVQKARFLNMELCDPSFELPHQIHYVRVPMQAEEYERYENAARDYVRSYEQQQARALKINLRGMIMKIRSMLELPPPHDSMMGAKAEALRTVVDGIAPTRNVLVYSIHRKSAGVVQEMYAGTRRAVFILNGGTAISSRPAILHGWRQTPGSILVAQLFVAGLGLNLQDVCSDVVFLLRWFNPAMETQAMRRVLRFGQTREVNIFYLQHENAYIECGWMDKIHAMKQIEEQQALGVGTESEETEEIDKLTTRQLYLLHENFSTTFADT